MKRRVSVIAVVPALNEEKTIASVIRAALKYVDQVIVVDDASTDKTSVLAQDAGAFVLKLSRRRKVGGVIKAGLEYAKKLKPKIVVTLDADGQHNPEDIPRLLKPVQTGMVDWVQGSRFLNRQIGSVKDLGNSFFSRLVSFLLCRKITDITGGFRVLTYDTLLGSDLKFEHESYPEMTITLCLKGYRMTEVPINNLARRYGTSKVVRHIPSYSFKALGIIFYTFFRNLKIHRRG